MGTWSAAIFADDTACDVRDEFTQLLSTGQSPMDATRALKKSWGPIVQDADDGPVFWLALAATQWTHGCLLPDVKSRALKLIERGTGLDRWEGLSGRRRETVLAALKARLLSPQPSPRRPRRRKAVEVRAVRVASPDRRAVAAAFELSPSKLPNAPRMQVLVDMEAFGAHGGGGVFVASCTFDEVSLEWQDQETLRIAYPRSATVIERKSTAFFNGRTIKLIYRKKPDA